MHDLLFFLKKWISVLFYPLGLSLAMMLVGVVRVLRGKGRSAAFPLIFGWVWLAVWSTQAASEAFLRPLEKMAGGYAQSAELRSKGVTRIVVLGGDMRVGVLTPADAAASTSLIRVMEAIRLWKGMPEAGLVLSGGALAKRPAVAQVMAAVTYELGIPRESVTLEAESLDTDDEARLLKPMLGKAPFAMVTSASHMPRAMMIFRRHGMNPISAPADFEASSPQSWEPRMFVPAVSALLLSHKAFHEYMGIAVVTLKNVTGPTVGK